MKAHAAARLIGAGVVFVLLIFGALFVAHRFLSAAALPPAPPQVDWPKIHLVEYLDGFQGPVYLTHAGDGSGRLFVAEQCGWVRVVRDGELMPAPFLDIHERVSCGSERALGSIAFPPDYASKGYFYAAYTDSEGDSVLSRFYVTADPDLADPDSEEILLHIAEPFEYHNIGQIVFGPDGYLYVGKGDGGLGSDPLNYGQSTDTLHGKILRIDVEAGVHPYAIPPDNPYVGLHGFRPEIWALGLRNPWRFSFDRTTGDLYIADVGQRAWEEINFQPASSAGGENYGWVILEGPQCHREPDCDRTGYTWPVAGYHHSGNGCAIIGGQVYRARLFPQLNGIYFFLDYCSGRLLGLQQTEAGWYPRILLRTGYDYSLTGFGEDEEGNIYVTQMHWGVIYRLEAE